MIKSDSINELAGALAKAQGEFKPIPKNKVVDFEYNGKRTYYRYADLQDVISMTTPILSKCGLSIVQNTEYENKELVLITTLLHSSGQFISSKYPLRIFTKNQEQGSELTYARRYTLSATLGVHSEEDEDGNIANQSSPENETSKDDVPDFKPSVSKPVTKKEGSKRNEL